MQITQIAAKGKNKSNGNCFAKLCVQEKESAYADTVTAERE